MAPPRRPAPIGKNSPDAGEDCVRKVTPPQLIALARLLGRCAARDALTTGRAETAQEWLAVSRPFDSTKEAADEG